MPYEEGSLVRLSNLQNSAYLGLLARKWLVHLLGKNFAYEIQLDELNPSKVRILFSIRYLCLRHFKVIQSFLTVSFIQEN